MPGRRMRDVRSHNIMAFKMLRKMAFGEAEGCRVGLARNGSFCPEMGQFPAKLFRFVRDAVSHRPSVAIAICVTNAVTSWRET